MSRKIQFLSLQKTELEYEVAIRGETPADTIVGLRKQIMQQIKCLPSEDILESHLEPKEDLKGAHSSLIKTQNKLQQLKTTFDRSLYLRTENLLNHVYHRLSRIDPTTTEDVKSQKDLTSHLKHMTKELNSLVPPTDYNPTISNTEEPVYNPATNIAVTCEKSVTADLSKIKFNGNTCVRAFIERVNEYMLARSISEEKILSYATEIFTDNALHWYRSIRESTTSWNDVIVRLKQDFDQFDYDYRLLAEIRARTQGEHENIAIYLSIMHGMFSRLTKKVSEDEKLEILLHNIRPCYASTLAASGEIKTISTLRSLCRNYELFQSRLSQFQEPPKVTADTLAPEFAYTRPSTSQNIYNKPKTTYVNSYHQSRSYNFQDNKSNVPVHAIETPKASKGLPYCPRCRSYDHSLKTCSAPKFLICFKCGKKDVTYPDCPDCEKPANYKKEANQKN